MLDSLLTLTKRGAFWLVMAWFLALLVDRAISGLLGHQEPIFVLAVLVIPLVLLVSGVYTLIKWLVRRVHHAPDADGPSDAD